MELWSCPTCSNRDYYIVKQFTTFLHITMIVNYDVKCDVNFTLVVKTNVKPKVKFSIAISM